MLPFLTPFTLNHEPAVIFIVAASTPHFALIVLHDIDFPFLGCRGGAGCFAVFGVLAFVCPA